MYTKWCDTKWYTFYYRLFRLLFSGLLGLLDVG